MGMLRVMLAMAVVLTHLPPAAYKFINGALAVQTFYIISGFYMALVLDGKYKSAGVFYSNRLLRLFPSYFAMSAIGAVCLFAFNASATASPAIFAQVFHNPVSALIMGFENLAVLGQELLFWFKIGPDGAFTLDPSGALPDAHVSLAWQALLTPQSWSLSMELMFYALAPFLARLGTRWLVAIAAASIALRLAGHLIPVGYGVWQGRLFPTALFLFLFGMLGHRASPIAARAPRWIGWTLALAAYAIVAASPLWGLGRFGEIVPGLVYVFFAAAIPFIFHASKDLAFDRWVGELSYPLYLAHLGVIGVVLTYAPASWPPSWQAAAAIGGALALAGALWLGIDRRLDLWRQKRARPPAREVLIELKPA
jgi:peptidoglycan/LPS O-acetylase OafA/YrhL